MAEFSDWAENKIIDLMRGTTFNGSTSYVALFTAVTGLETGTPTAEVVAGSGYARQVAGLSAASAGTSANGTDITFPTATPGAWGTVSHVAIVDHVSNGSWGTNVFVYMWSALDTAKDIQVNDTFKINAGDLDVSVA